MSVGTDQLNVSLKLVRVSTLFEAELSSCTAEACYFILFNNVSLHTFPRITVISRRKLINRISKFILYLSKELVRSRIQDIIH